jgi:hypothetical protein
MVTPIVLQLSDAEVKKSFVGADAIAVIRSYCGEQ